MTAARADARHRSFRTSSRQAKGAPSAMRRWRSRIGERLVEAGIERHAVRIARPVRPRLSASRDEGADFAAAHEGGIDEIFADQPLEHASRSRQNARTGGAPALPIRCRAIPGREKCRPRIPACSASCRCPRCAAAACPPAFAGHICVEQRRIGMAEMQFAVRARREAEVRLVICLSRDLPACQA